MGALAAATVSRRWCIDPLPWLTHSPSGRTRHASHRGQRVIVPAAEVDRGARAVLTDPGTNSREHTRLLPDRKIDYCVDRPSCTKSPLRVHSLESNGGLLHGIDLVAVGAANGTVARHCRDCDRIRRSVRDREFSAPLEGASERSRSWGPSRIDDAKLPERPLLSAQRPRPRAGVSLSAG